MKIKCSILNCSNEMTVEKREVTYVKFLKKDGKTLEGHRAVCPSCVPKLKQFKGKLTNKFVYGN